MDGRDLVIKFHKDTSSMLAVIRFLACLVEANAYVFGYVMELDTYLHGFSSY